MFISSFNEGKKIWYLVTVMLDKMSRIACVARVVPGQTAQKLCKVIVKLCNGMKVYKPVVM